MAHTTANPQPQQPEPHVVERGSGYSVIWPTPQPPTPAPEPRR